MQFVSSWSGTIYAWKIFEYEGEGALRVPVYPIKSLILLGSDTAYNKFFHHLLHGHNNSALFK